MERKSSSQVPQLKPSRLCFLQGKTKENGPLSYKSKRPELLVNISVSDVLVCVCVRE
eukprot:c45274_g1_i1 orf=82-252(+)